jgi:predicted short-subunit dehydrogenase-like oxidoreductase (DUF2520 family)
MAANSRSDTKSQHPQTNRLKLEVSIVGSGRLGTALGIALSRVGCNVLAVVSRTKSKSRKAARLIGPSVVALDARGLDEIPPSDALLITTPDDSIKMIAGKLASISKPSSKRRVALHASGALSSEVLSSLRGCGYSIGSMHPLSPISDPVSGADALGSAYFCIEGDAAAVRMARRLVRAIGANHFSIDVRDKAAYHAAAMMAAGHVVALFDMAIEIMMECGLDKHTAQKVLVPLTSATVKSLERKSPSLALTGSFARADIETVKKHLAALFSHDDISKRLVYAILGLHSLDLASKPGAKEEAVESIRRLLEEAIRSSKNLTKQTQRSSYD